jgi:ABC-type phosphate transport system substrate-binding protein
VPGARVLALALTMLSTMPFVSAKDMAVISNKSNHVQAMTMPDLIKICRGQTNRWPDGKAVTFITRDPALPDMRLVLDKIYAIPKDQVRSLIDTANHGRTDHPAIVVVDSDEAVVKKVESTPGAAGLVDVYAISSGVTVLRLGNKLPLEPGYPLHGN